MPALQFFRGIEVQQRGALHDHAMVWTPSRLQKGRLREIAMAAGFGHSIDLAPITSAKQVGYYVSKYVTKATDSRDDVPWLGQVVDVETGEVTEQVVAGRYRTWSMSREWGLTMAAVRAEGRRWYAQQELAVEAQAFEYLGAAFEFHRIEQTAASPPS